MLRIGILGYSGRMGQLIAQEVAASDKCTLAGGLVREAKPEFKKSEGILITEKPGELIAISDVVVDFTTTEMTPEFARLASAHGKAFLSGTTGFGAEGQKALRTAAEKIPVLHASNTSLSLTVMKRLTELAAKLLGDRDYDVAVIDEHHAQKKDAPSGTAKTLGEAVARGSGGKKTPRFSSIRSGDIVGEHEVIFAGAGETIRLHHSVTDRRIFARGAVEAALWLHGKPPGLYAMEDVLGIAR
jgi:4-hydroxy-tetrahydrodipicolinate reductase